MKSITFPLAIWALAGLTALPPAAAQNTPERLSYQGLVTDANGNNIGATGAVNRKVQFKIYEAATGGDPVWAEEQTATVSDGEFSVAIGGGSGISGLPGSVAPGSPTNALATALATAGKSYYLGVTIDDGSGTIDGNDKEIAPRQQLLSGAFALRAKTAEQVSSSAVNSDMIQDSTIVANDLAANAVQTGKVQDSAITSAKIADAAVATADLANASVTKDKINTSSVGLWDVNGSSVYRNSGNVGIQTSNPQYPLDIYGADYGEARIRGGNVAQLRLEDNNAASVYWLHNNDDRLYFLWNGGTTVGGNNWLGDYTMVFNGVNVGLGTNNPQARLHVMGSGLFEAASAPALTLKSGSYNTQLGLATSYGQYAANASAGDGVLRNVSGGGLCLLSGAGNYALRVGPSNDVYMGRVLRFNSHWEDGKLGNDYGNILFNYENGNVDEGQLVFETGDNGNEEMIFKQNQAERMRIADDGEVRIWGFDGQGALNVGSSSQTFNSYGKLNTDGGSGNNNLPMTAQLSIHASGHVLAAEFNISSDARMKSVLGVSDRSNDLSILDALRITDYRYVDQIANGAGVQKKVIAQQVEEVFPQAVTRSRGTVPDVYRTAPAADGWIHLATNLQQGERVKVIHGETVEVLEVLEANPGAFRVALDAAVREVFVYGREVDDFRSVDYDAISMLNVSATQELYHRLRTLEERLADIEERLGTR